MTRPDDRGVGPADILLVLKGNLGLWLVPTVALTIFAGLYAAFVPPKWEASQAMMVRREVTGSGRSDGKFADLTEMKTVQETILELTKGRTVLEATLLSVGTGWGQVPSASRPSAKEIADLREEVKMQPPKGSEFGKTEVFYVTVRDRSKQRAIALVDSLCRQLELRYQELRDVKAQSMIDELIRAEAMTESELVKVTQRLGSYEAEVGADLTELRILHASPSSSSNTRQRLVAVENELRRYEADKRRHEQLLQILKAIHVDPEQFLATPNSLLASHPALRRLKDGLVDAQLRTAELAGKMKQRHPLTQAARDSEDEIRGNLRDEVAMAIRGTEVELQLTTDRVDAFEKQLVEDRERLERVAGMRAEYATLIASSENRTKLLEDARRNLAEARASQAAARSASLLSRIDAPDGGIQPVGPGKWLITMTGCVGGLMIGLGVAFLLAGSPSPVRPNRHDAHRSRSEHVDDHYAAGIEEENGNILSNVLKRLLNKPHSNGSTRPRSR